ERRAVLAGLDCLTQPNALLVIGDVLDLVRNRSGVGLDQARQRVRERLARDVQTQHRCGHARLQLRRQPRDEALRFQRGIARRRHSLGTESGFSRYSSRRSRAKPELSPSTSVTTALCSSGGRYHRGWLVTTATAMPTAKHAAPTATAIVARRSLRPPMPMAMS